MGYECTVINEESFKIEPLYYLGFGNQALSDTGLSVCCSVGAPKGSHLEVEVGSFSHVMKALFISFSAAQILLGSRQTILVHSSLWAEC